MRKNCKSVNSISDKYFIVYLFNYNVYCLSRRRFDDCCYLYRNDVRSTCDLEEQIVINVWKLIKLLVFVHRLVLFFRYVFSDPPVHLAAFSVITLAWLQSMMWFREMVWSVVLHALARTSRCCKIYCPCSWNCTPNALTMSVSSQFNQVIDMSRQGDWQREQHNGSVHQESDTHKKSKTSR